MEATGRQHLGNHICETTERPHLSGREAEDTKQQQEWETTPQKPHLGPLGDNWETASGKEVDDNETTTRPGANIWETKSRRQLERPHVGDRSKTTK